MASFNPRKFADPDRLRGIAPARLRAFLAPWAGYLGKRGFVFPDTSGNPPDYDALAQIMLTPDSETPTEMVDALHYVHETARAQDMEELIAEAKAQGVVIDDDPQATPIDLAIDVWRVAPDLVRDRHAEAIALRQQNFEYFAPRRPLKGPLPALDDARRAQIEAYLADWFEAHRRGRGCRLFVFRHPHKTWILIRHGETMRRESSQGDDGVAGTEFYRPQRHDVLLYDERSGDIGVHAKTKGERNLYLRALGHFLFQDEAHFPPADRFSLNPLVTHGVGALNVEDIDGIATVRLVEYRRYWGGAHRETETIKAENVFGALAARSGRSLAGGRLVSATFKVAFDGAAKERSVTIRPPGIARFERNEDSDLLEHWMRERRFILTGQDADDDDAPTAVLADA
jgi:hypothetical protein